MWFLLGIASIIISPIALLICALAGRWQTLRRRWIVKCILHLIERNELSQQQRWALLDKLVDMTDDSFRDK